MKRLIIHLNGGIGNQMFQYAFGRSMALDLNYELVLDNWSGYVRDHVYQRQYELGKMKIKGRIANNCERIPFWLHRFESKYTGDVMPLHRKHLYGDFVKETTYIYHANLFSALAQRNTWIFGYWQSPRYFSKHNP